MTKEEIAEIRALLFYIQAHTDAPYLGFHPQSVPNTKRVMVNKAAIQALKILDKA